MTPAPITAPFSPITLRIVSPAITKDGLTKVDAENRNGKVTIKIATTDLYAKIIGKLKRGDVVRILEGTSVGKEEGKDTLTLNAPDLEVLEGKAKEEAIQTDLENPQATEAMRLIKEKVGSIQCTLLKAICEEFLTRFGTTLLRTAAARKYHHARRGGLAEHTAGMMKLGDAIASTTPCNRDLLITGILFHDSGKLFEHLEAEDSHEIQENLQGELLGHITAGILLAHKCAETASTNLGVNKTNHAQETRAHLIHLIASHHGKAEWGSPITPKTKEAFLLHSIDMIDANLDMIDAALGATPEYTAETGSSIHPKISPLPTRMVSSLKTNSP